MPRYTVKPPLTSQRNYTFGDPAHRGSDIVRLGRLAEAGQMVDVNFDTSGEFVVGIFGKRGSGKSYCLGAFLESLCTTKQDTTIGRCARSRAVLLFDTLNIFWTTAQALTEDDKEAFPDEWRAMTAWGIVPPETDAAVYVPRGFGSESLPGVLEFALPPSTLTVDDWADLIEADLYSDRVGQLLFDVYTKVTTDGWSDGQAAHDAIPEFEVDDLLECLQNDADIQNYYNSETIRALAQRIRGVGALSFFGGTHSSLSALLQPGRLSIIQLNRLPDTLRSVLVSVLMRRVLAERAEASELEKQLRLNRRLSADDRKRLESRVAELVPPTVVALDEAQNVLPSERGTKATQTIIKYVREGRNHGLSFIFTTQQPSAIDARILAQVDTIVGHKLTIAADVRRFEENLKSRNPDAVQTGGRALAFADWLRSLSQGQAIVSNTEEERNFVIDVRPRVCLHGGQGAF